MNLAGQSVFDGKGVFWLFICCLFWHICRGSHEQNHNKFFLCIQFFLMVLMLKIKGEIMELSQIKVLWERWHILMRHLKYWEGQQMACVYLRLTGIRGLLSVDFCLQVFVIVFVFCLWKNILYSVSLLPGILQVLTLSCLCNLSTALSSLVKNDCRSHPSPGTIPSALESTAVSFGIDYGIRIFCVVFIWNTVICWGVTKS